MKDKNQAITIIKTTLDTFTNKNKPLFGFFTNINYLECNRIRQQFHSNQFTDDVTSYMQFIKNQHASVNKKAVSLITVLENILLEIGITDFYQSNKEDLFRRAYDRAYPSLPRPQIAPGAAAALTLVMIDQEKLSKGRKLLLNEVMNSTALQNEKSVIKMGNVN